MNLINFSPLNFLSCQFSSLHVREYLMKNQYKRHILPMTQDLQFHFRPAEKSLSINWFNFILDISRLTCTSWWIIKEKISSTLMSGHRDRQKGSLMPHSLNRLSMSRQKILAAVESSIEVSCKIVGIFLFRLCLRLLLTAKSPWKF